MEDEERYNGAVNNPAFEVDEHETNGNRPEYNLNGVVRKPQIPPILDDDPDENYRCGYGSWTPAFLQRFHNPKFLLAALSLCTISQGLVINGLVPVSITTLEKRFHLSSTQSGFFSSMYDVAVTLVLIPLAHFGNKGHKGRWLGFGMMIFSIGSLICAIPQFTTGLYRYSNGELGDLCSSSPIAAFTAKCGGPEAHLKNYFFVLLLGQLFHGIGASPLYTLGVAYIDENVSQRSSPVYLGIYIALSTVGPAFGFILGGIFLGQYGDFYKANMTQVNADLNGPGDPRWYGGWWIGFILTACMAFVFSIPVLCFARRLPGAITIPGGMIGNILGGYLMRRFNLMVRQTLVLAVACQIICLLMTFIFLIQCDKTAFAGVTVPYLSPSSTPLTSSINLTHSCNLNCGCSNVYRPVCDEENKISFYSPCYAGCSKFGATQGNDEWNNCACTFSSQNSTVPASTRKLVSGICPVGCPYFPLFLVCFGFLVLATFTASMPVQQVQLRCVDYSQRTLALGVNWIFVRVLGSIPGAVLFGLAIDQTCILWKYQCKEKQSCLRYSSQNLSFVLMGFGIALKILNSIALLLARWKYKAPADPNKLPSQSSQANILPLAPVNGSDTGKVAPTSDQKIVQRF